ncbi:MAG: SGNH/GDSL hydrolase family protein [Bacillota bacterium]|nr:SGNH/GDSL hydrolase family protein [Bacillota bacterium]
MKKKFKRSISLAMCAVLLFGVLGTAAFAEESKEYDNLPYKCYTYIGDSIPWGYGLNPDIETSDPNSVCLRVEGAYTDLVGKVLEENNGAAVHAAASSGSRLCDYRAALEKGMGVENPYNRTDDWFGNRTPERTELLRSKGEQMCAWISESDLISLQCGINDITALLVNTLCASGLVDINKITAIDDAEAVLDYLQFALSSLEADPNVLGNIISGFKSELTGIRENAAAVVGDVVEIAPEDADIVIVGYSNLLAGMRVIPGTDFSLIMDLIDTALVSLNDYYSSIADDYDNVYYVDAPDASVFFSEGMLITDAISDERGILLGLHPDAEGHEYIAGCVLDALKEINTCRHEHTKTVLERVKSTKGYGYMGVQVCTDCGKVVSMGKVVTPFGTFDVPEKTVNSIVVNIGNAVSSTLSRLINGICSISAKR